MRLLLLISFLLLLSPSNIIAQSTPNELEAKALLSSHLDKSFHQAEEEKGHHHGSLPKEVNVESVEIQGKKAIVYLNFPNDFLENTLDDHLFEEIFLSISNVFDQKFDFQTVQLQVAGEDAVFKPIEAYFNTPTKQTIPVLPKNKDPFPPNKGNLNAVDKNTLGGPQPTGSLSGKTVWLSPGHGWLYNTSLSNFITQRGTTNQMVEDFGSVEAINYYLLRYFWNAGAKVNVVRERDVNTNEVIVDNDDAAPAYIESGNWATSGSTGYDGGTYNYINSSSTESGTASFTPNIPEAGWYWVSVYYRSGTNRSVDTRYKVQHAGGESIVSVNQEIHGLTWVYLGEFYFDAGSNGKVVLSNESSETGQAIIADAVRFGGGVGGDTDCANANSGTSNRPRFEESARQYAQFMGYPTCESDVTIRPNYAEWELLKGLPSDVNNAIYISWHTNAFNGTARGTVTYAHDTDPTPGSYDLQNFVHTELVNDIFALWDPSWNDRGVKYANFGEVRELDYIPGCLLEVAFHDNETDAQALTTPYFRDLAARAVYQGAVKFFNDRDGSPLDLLPEKPTHVYAKNTAEGEITLSWQAPLFGGALGDQATGYKVYMGTHGKGFPDGIPVNGTSYTFTGLDAATTYYFRVSATNAGGESFQSPVLAARTPRSGSNNIPWLIVDGFDRLDRSGAVMQYESAALGEVRRLFLERMNSFDYAVEHAKGLASCDQSFDGALNEAVISGTVALADYIGVDWFLGEESTGDMTFDSDEKLLVVNYLEQGGNLIVSGAEIGWELEITNPDASFYNNYLKANYVGDSGGSYNFQGVSNDIFDGIAGSFDDGSNGYYDTAYPDRLGTAGGSDVVLNYVGGTGDGAATSYIGPDFGVVNFGFPLETVTDETVRNNLFCNATSSLTPNLNLGLKLILSANYNATTGLMDDALRTLNYLPFTQPYEAITWDYRGTETVDPSVFAVSGNDAIVDWLLIELRDENSNTTIVESRAALLQRDGDVVDIDGVSPLAFSGLKAGFYYIAIKHRNHLGIMTANPVPLSDAVLMLNFADGSAATWGN